MKVLTPAERLIVAADYRPPLGLAVGGEGRKWVRSKVLSLADSLKGTGVYIKVNSALRACGYDLISEIRSRGLRVFADLKLYDIGETLSTDGVLLCEEAPELLTVVCSTGKVAMQALKKEFLYTEVLGVTILTSVTQEEANRTYSFAVLKDSVCMFARNATDAGMDGIICAATEIELVRKSINDWMTINTPAIRPTWAIVPGDDQNPDRIMTPFKAIKAGADRIVVGRPIVQSKNPYDAAMRTIDEIASASA